MWSFFFVFFFNDTATTEIYTLSLHDALPISRSERLERQEPVHRLGGRAAVRDRRAGGAPRRAADGRDRPVAGRGAHLPAAADRKSTRLNSSHANISYAVFCLKKKKNRDIKDI